MYYIYQEGGLASLPPAAPDLANFHLKQMFFSGMALTSY